MEVAYFDTENAAWAKEFHVGLAGQKFPCTLEN